MVQHSFGGEWSTEKLDCLRKYLEAYRMIFCKNQRARHLTTNYVDAFAGTGYRTPSSNKRLPENPTLLFDDLDQDSETQEYLKGSARIALEVTPPFQYLRQLA